MDSHLFILFWFCCYLIQHLTSFCARNSIFNRSYICCFFSPQKCWNRLSLNNRWEWLTRRCSRSVGRSWTCPVCVLQTCGKPASVGTWWERSCSVWKTAMMEIIVWAQRMRKRWQHWSLTRRLCPTNSYLCFCIRWHSKHHMTLVAVSLIFTPWLVLYHIDYAQIQGWA